MMANELCHHDYRGITAEQHSLPRISHHALLDQIFGSACLFFTFWDVVDVYYLFHSCIVRRG